MVCAYWLLISFAFCLLFPADPCHAEISESPSSNKVKADFSLKQGEMDEDKDFEDFPDDFEDEDYIEDLIPDPLEPANRVFFRFNDKMYYWVVKPIATYYTDTVPEQLRISVRSFFSNLQTPIRAINCLLQYKFEGAGRELIRFSLNSLWLGLCDPASQTFKIRGQDEDLGQTLGSFGLGPGIYINWPVLGPSSLRDTVGWGGDAYLDPLNYLEVAFKYDIAISGYKTLNSASFRLGEYESLEKAALDPYIALREAYHENRQHKIKE